MNATSTQKIREFIFFLFLFPSYAHARSKPFVVQRVWIRACVFASDVWSRLWAMPRNNGRMKCSTQGEQGSINAE